MQITLISFKWYSLYEPPLHEPSNPILNMRNWPSEPLVFSYFAILRVRERVERRRMTMQLWFIRLFESSPSSWFLAYGIKNVVALFIFFIPDFTATFTCRDSMELFADGISLGKDNQWWRTATDFVIPGNTEVIAVAATNSRFPPGILGSFSNGLVTNTSWKCSEHFSFNLLKGLCNFERILNYCSLLV